MICYTRTTREGAKLILRALGDIPAMVISSRRSKTLVQVTSDAERIIHNLEWHEGIVYVPVELSNRVIVIESVRRQDAQIREAVMGLRGVEWTTLEGEGCEAMGGPEWAYQGRNGIIRFKLWRMQKPRVWEGATVHPAV